ncbi:hypothetical protein ACFX11_005014 [Malus domestica]
MKTGDDRSKVRGKDERAAARLGKMPISDRHLLMENESYTKEILQEVPIEKQEIGEFIQMTPDGEKKVERSKKMGFSSQGGGRWPYSAARSP